MVDAETAKLDLEHARGDSVQGRQEHEGGCLWLAQITVPGKDVSSNRK